MAAKWYLLTGWQKVRSLSEESLAFQPKWVYVFFNMTMSRNKHILPRSEQTLSTGDPHPLSNSGLPFSGNFTTITTKTQELVQPGIKTFFFFSIMSVLVIFFNGVITIVAELPILSSLSGVTVCVIFSCKVPSTTRYHTIVERGVLRTSFAKLRG